MLSAIKFYTFLTFTKEIMVYFIGKKKPKISHFDIWSIWALCHIGQVDFNMFNLISGFLTNHKISFWLVKLDKNIGNQINLI
jgi:hypothetical protein